MSPTSSADRADVSDEQQEHEQQKLLQTLRQRINPTPKVIDSGYAALNDVLPGGGWPLGCLFEVYGNDGDQSLLMPALRALNQQARHTVWLQPPHIPYLPGLRQRGLSDRWQLLITPENDRDALWSMEQLLRSPLCGAVQAWISSVKPLELRRLQLAAETTGCMAILHRPLSQLSSGSPAALRLRVATHEGQLMVELLKLRGGSPQTVMLTPPQRLSA